MTSRMQGSILAVGCALAAAGCFVGMLDAFSDKTISLAPGTWVTRPSDGSFVCRIDKPVQRERRTAMLSPYFWLYVCDDWEDEKPTTAARPKWLRSGWTITVHTDGGWK